MRLRLVSYENVARERSMLILANVQFAPRFEF